MVFVMAKKKPARTDKSHNGQDTKQEEKASQIPDVVAIHIARRIPDNQVGVTCNHLVVQRDGPEFHLLFFQTQPPIFLGETDEQKLQEIERLKEHGVSSLCIARIIVATERMPSFIAAMQKNLGQHQASQEAGSGENK
jgi:hypothetical protein